MTEQDQIVYAVYVNSLVPQLCKWLVAKYGLHFELHTTLEKPPPGLDSDGVQSHACGNYLEKIIYVWLGIEPVGEMLKVICHEYIHFLLIRDGKRPAPTTSIQYYREDLEIDEQAKAMRDEFLKEIASVQN